MEGSEPMGAWGSGTTFCGSPGNACFVFAFVSTITSELGLEEMQPERATANKQITAILNFRSIAKQYLICELSNFPVREGVRFMLQESKRMKQRTTIGKIMRNQSPGSR